MKAHSENESTFRKWKHISKMKELFENESTLWKWKHISRNWMHLYASKNIKCFFIFDFNPYCCCFRCRVFFMTILREDSWQQPMIIIGNPFRHINSLFIDNSDLSGHWAIRHQRLVWLLQYMYMPCKKNISCLSVHFTRRKHGTIKFWKKEGKSFFLKENKMC